MSTHPTTADTLLGLEGLIRMVRYGQRRVAVDAPGPQLRAAQAGHPDVALEPLDPAAAGPEGALAGIWCGTRLADAAPGAAAAALRDFCLRLAPHGVALVGFRASGTDPVWTLETVRALFLDCGFTVTKIHRVPDARDGEDVIYAFGSRRAECCTGTPVPLYDTHAH
ncbi:hypothetical protein ACQKM2_37075 [Streptomyces sp. NPDC004126]|uniref:hypothetical protein n=1 Tax=Streptomyces sp. NPDC004126 TaxID=3390695 RepID=UPI003D01FB5D